MALSGPESPATTPPVARKVAFNATVSAASNVVGKLSTLAWTAVAARQLTRADFGAFNVALALGLILAAVSEWGFDTALVQRVSRDPSRLTDELTACLVWELGLGAILFLGGGSVAVLRTSPGARLALVVILAATFMDTIADTLRAASAAVQRQGGTAVALGVQRIVTAALVVPVILTSAHLLPFAVAFLVGTLVGTVAHVSAVRRLGARFTPFRTGSQAIRRFARRTSAIGVSALVLAALFRVDTLLVAAFEGDAAVASYATAYKLFDTALFVAFAINGAIFPVFSARVTDPPAFGQAFRNAVAAVAAVYLPFAAVCLVDPSGVLRLLFGDQYADTAASSLRWLAAAPIVFGVAFLTASAITAVGRIRALLVAAVAATVINLGIDLVAIPAMGGAGAAMMTTAAYVVQGAVLLMALRRAGYRVPVLRPLFEPLIAAAAAAGILVVLPLPFVVEVLVAMAAYGVVWFGLVARPGSGGLASIRAMLARSET